MFSALARGTGSVGSDLSNSHSDRNKKMCHIWNGQRTSPAANVLKYALLFQKVCVLFLPPRVQKKSPHPSVLLAPWLGSRMEWVRWGFGSLLSVLVGSPLPLLPCGPAQILPSWALSCFFFSSFLPFSFSSSQHVCWRPWACVGQLGLPS